MKVVVFSIVPSPYQRDFFKAFSEKVQLQVYYLEPSSPDSPWPEKPLEDFEHVLPGTFISIRGMRFHFNWSIPKIKNADAVILNGYMAILFQWFLRFNSRRQRLIFWGERMAAQSTGLKGQLQQWLSEGLSNCKAIVAIGTRAQREYQLRFPHVPIFNIPYHCSIETFLQVPLRKNTAHVQFLFCGQMIYRKGLDVLLTAFEKLDNLNVKLHLVGREAELKEMLSKLSEGCRSKIIYHGFQPPDRLHEFFAMADVFVLPSRYDGWGVVVNQALAAGLPVICSGQVGANDLVDEGGNGFQFTAGDAEMLFTKMMNFVREPDLLLRMSIKARERSYLISPEQGSEKWLQVLKQTLHQCEYENSLYKH